jgi:hypothetical protein
MTNSHKRNILKDDIIDGVNKQFYQQYKSSIHKLMEKRKSIEIVEIDENKDKEY